MTRRHPRVRVVQALAAAVTVPLVVPLLPAHAAPASAPSSQVAPASVSTVAKLTMRGADVSTLQRNLELGATYTDAKGNLKDPLNTLKARGVNWARLRVWNSTPTGDHTLPSVLTQAKTLKAKKLKLLIDLHYSDTWADPGHQSPPAAWSGHNLAQLRQDVYKHTYDVCTALTAQGTPPDAMQIGNEINVGMLWPYGKVVNNDFAPLASLLKEGYNAVKACRKQTKVIIHTADADNLDHARWFYDGIAAQGVPWDLTGLSYYCHWHGPLSTMASVVKDAKYRYNKDVVIVETAYPFTTANADSQGNTIDGSTLCDGVPATWEGQAQQFTAVQDTARAAGAIGVFYWEPTWTAIKGNGWDPADMWGTGDGWDNMALFDWHGRLNPNIQWKP